MDTLLKAFQKVTRDWEAFEIVVFIVLFPLSGIYLAFRMLQEMD
jgi:hypothetical protein